MQYIFNDLIDIDEDTNGVFYAYDLQIMISASTNNISNMKYTAEDILNKLKTSYDNNRILVITNETRLIFLETSHSNKKNSEDFSLNFNGTKFYP